MDQYLEITLSWFQQLGITKIDEDKLKRQLSIISSWFKNNGIGVLEAVTGLTFKNLNFIFKALL